MSKDLGSRIWALPVFAGRSAALRAEPATQSQAKPAAANAKLLAEFERCAREAGWPDEMYLGLALAAIGLRA